MHHLLLISYFGCQEIHWSTKHDWLQKVTRQQVYRALSSNSLHMVNILYHQLLTASLFDPLPFQYLLIERARVESRKQIARHEKLVVSIPANYVSFATCPVRSLYVN